MRTSWWLCIAALAAAVPLARAEEVEADETKTWVPELSALHEVIHPLWHKAWPTKDTTLVRALWPKVQERVAAVEKAELPGILREKKEVWQTGVQRLSAAKDAYGAALEGGTLQAKLDAVEELHASFEGLARSIRPAMIELEEFHRELYGIYHHVVPAKDSKALVQRLPALEKSMEKLGAAEIPQGTEEEMEQFESARDRLSAAVDTVAATASGEDWEVTAMAIEEMHTAYRELAGLLQ